MTQFIPSHERAARLNAFKHGLRATDVLFLSRLLPEEREMVDELRDMLYNRYEPQGAIEQLIVDKLAIHNFRQLRLYRIEYNSMNSSMNHDPTGESTLPHLDRLSRYDSRIALQLRSLEQTLLGLQRNRQPAPTSDSN